MPEKKIPRSFGTHDGTFHADEITACALLLLFDLIDEKSIIRTRDLNILATCEYVCDVGGVYNLEKKLFDHHQIEYQGNLSSAGMVLEYLKNKGLLSDHEYDFFNQSLIIGVDAHDNGKEMQSSGVCTFSHIIANFTPIAYDADFSTQQETFTRALHFALGHLKRMWERYHYIRSCRQLVIDAMKNNSDCLIFKKAIPWMETFFELGGADHSALFVIMPSGSHWKLRGIPPSHKERMQVRYPLPQKWAGLLDTDLKRITEIPGAIFCHKGRFISVWETFEDAKKALQYVLQEKEGKSK